jgi:hypothetical protein
VKAILNRPLLCALVTGTMTLVLGATLLQRAHFGVPPALGVAALAILFTVGLPAMLGVAAVAAVWGHIPGLVGFGLFVPCAIVIALMFQYGTCLLAQHATSGFSIGRGKEEVQVRKMKSYPAANSFPGRNS